MKETNKPKRNKQEKKKNSVYLKEDAVQELREKERR